MAENTAIEWADATFNPWIGCSAISPGCENCYASSFAKRVGRDFATRTRTSEANWKEPLKWERKATEFFAEHGRRQRVFCASLADVFDNEVPPAWRAELFALIASTPNLDWLVLSKRIGNVAKMIEAPGMQKCGLPANVWLGATVVNQTEANRDIPKLLAVPARVRFLSIEPMLGPIDLTRVMRSSPDSDWTYCDDVLRGFLANKCGGHTSPDNAVQWVILGGESGPGARPMHPDWARSLRDQCAAAGTAFLFKQWGEWVPYEHSAQPPFLWSQHGHEIDGHALPDFETEDGRKQREWYCDFADMILARRVGKKAAGRLLDGVEHNGFPTLNSST
jgi:protein gp37